MKLDSNTSPDLILLDVNMPGMNGWDFLQEYRQLPESIRKHIVVIILTTSLNPDDHTKAKTILSFLGTNTNR